MLAIVNNMALKILLAPNSYKGSVSAEEAFHSFLDGVYYFNNITNHPIETRKILICDGGTGFADIISSSFKNASRINLNIIDPLFREIESYYYQSEYTAIIESAKAIGHSLLSSEELNPMNTTSYGLGQLIKHAIDNGAKHILLGCGDTATTDGGIGMLSALGVEFFNKNGDQIYNPTGKSLYDVASVDFTVSKYFNHSINIEVACNLSSIASGKDSTALVYSKQKGATNEEAHYLFQGITQYTNIIGKYVNQPHLGLIPGTGSAGGVGFGIASFFKNTKLRYSFEVVFEKIEIDKYLEWADVVITGEGLFDKNSVKGKAPVAIALRSKLYNTIPIAIVGGIQSNITSRLLRSGFEIIEPLTAHNISKDYYIEHFDELARDAIVRALLKIYRFYINGKSI